MLVETRDNGTYLFFDNLRDASLVYNNLHIGDQGWRAVYVSPRQVACVGVAGITIALQLQELNTQQAIDEGDELVAKYDAHVDLVAEDRSPVPRSRDIMASVIQQLLEDEGEVLTFQIRPSVMSSVLLASVEFCDTKVSIATVAKYNNSFFDASIHCTQ